MIFIGYSDKRQGKKYINHNSDGSVVKLALAKN